MKISKFKNYLGFRQFHKMADEEEFQSCHGGFILCALRSMTEEHCIETAKLAAKFLGKGVLGMDVAGDEGSFPLNSE